MGKWSLLTWALLVGLLLACALVLGLFEVFFGDDPVDPPRFAV